MGSSAPAQPAVVDVLLVEDDPGDALLVAEALAGRPVRLHTVANGDEALAFLRRAGEVPRPGLILLDLNLPGLDGREVLSRIKNDESLRAIPVVVLTSSAAQTDVLDSYACHANAYITKPLDAAAFATALHQVEAFFTTVVRLPR
ncbi:response regulator [Actinokineospora sp. 24-640]